MYIPQPGHGNEKKDHRVLFQPMFSSLSQLVDVSAHLGLQASFSPALPTIFLKEEDTT